MANRLKRCKEIEDKVLASIAEGNTATHAVKGTGVAYRTVYQWKQDDPEFDAKWQAAMEAGTQVLEQEAKRRAIEGSDQLLMFLLRGKRPEQYRERSEVKLETKANLVLDLIPYEELGLVKPGGDDGD